MKKILCLLFVLSFFAIAQAQNVGIGTNTPDASAQLDISSTTRGFLPPRMDSAKRNAINSPAVGLTIYNTTTNGLECWNGTKWYSAVHYIGESYGGGIVFYIYDNGLHGLIAATADQSSGIQWYNGINKYTGSSDLGGIGSGAMNTALIIAAQINDNPISTNFAARVCADYYIKVGGISDNPFEVDGAITYGGWYLPSRLELYLLYLQKIVIGGFANSPYWSSSEQSINTANIIDFSNGSNTIGTDKNNTLNVRAIRSF